MSVEFSVSVSVTLISMLSASCSLWMVLLKSIVSKESVTLIPTQTLTVNGPLGVDFDRPDYILLPYYPWSPYIKLELLEIFKPTNSNHTQFKAKITWTKLAKCILHFAAECSTLQCDHMCISMGGQKAKCICKQGSCLRKWLKHLSTWVV